MFDKIELLGPLTGKLLDSKLFIYEIKAKHPPIRLYFKHNLATNEIYVFEFEMKKVRANSKEQSIKSRVNFLES